MSPSNSGNAGSGGNAGTIRPFNFSRKATQIPVAPDGNYVLVFVKHDIKVVQSGNNAGAPMISVQAKPNAEFHPQQRNNTMFRNIPLIAPDEESGQRGTFWVMNSFLEALGLGEDELESFNLDTLREYWGRGFVAAVTTREYEGEKRNEFNKFKAWDGTMPDGAPSQDGETDADADDAAVASGRSRLR